MIRLPFLRPREPQPCQSDFEPHEPAAPPRPDDGRIRALDGDWEPLQ